MFKQIIQEILSGGMKSKQDIAKAIGVDISTLDDMLKLLIQRGMLRSSSCEMDESVCSRCSASRDSCTSDQFGQTYQVTERGRKYAQSVGSN
ncbi:MAG: FeoC-like transcriptional regulator [Candidatus Thorarchaeota archaeon]